jgi:hypothetical protein
MPFVSLLLVTKRPGFLPEIFGMMARQSFRDHEIILITHGFQIDDLDPTIQDLAGAAAEIQAVPAAWSLGRCLNEAIRHARGDVLAKIDDDDLYAREYLAEAVAAYRGGAAEIIGKLESYAYFKRSRSIVLRHPGYAYSFREDGLHGPTLLFSRRLGENPGFRDIPCRVDTVFGDDCRALGERLFATSRRNFIHRRFDIGHDHTSPLDDAYIAARGTLIRAGIADDSPRALLALIGDTDV